MTPFGRRMNELRRQRGITQKHLAEALGVSSAYLSSIERGRRGRPPFALVERIIGYFEIIWDDADELRALADLSHPRARIDTSELSASATRLASQLERTIRQLDEAALDDLNARLEEHLHRIRNSGSGT